MWQENLQAGRGKFSLGQKSFKYPPSDSKRPKLLLREIKQQSKSQIDCWYLASIEGQSYNGKSHKTSLILAIPQWTSY